MLCEAFLDKINAPNRVKLARGACMTEQKLNLYSQPESQTFIGLAKLLSLLS